MTLARKRLIVKELVRNIETDEEIILYEELTGKGGGPAPEVAEWLEVGIKFAFGSILAGIFYDNCKAFVKKLFKAKVEEDKQFGFGKKIIVSGTTVNSQSINYIFSASFNEDVLYEAYTELKKHFFHINKPEVKVDILDYVYSAKYKEWIGF